MTAVAGQHAFMTGPVRGGLPAPEYQRLCVFQKPNQDPTMTARAQPSRRPPISFTAFELAAYFSASRTAVRGPARETATYADAMEALHILASTASTEPLRTAARRSLALARHRLCADYGHPHHAEHIDIRPGRGVWAERADRRGCLQTVPATVLDIDATGGRALLALEAEPHIRWWTQVCLLTVRVAGVSHLPDRSASPATPKLTEATA